MIKIKTRLATKPFSSLIKKYDISILMVHAYNSRRVEFHTLELDLLSFYLYMLTKHSATFPTLDEACTYCPKSSVCNVNIALL